MAGAIVETEFFEVHVDIQYTSQKLLRELTESPYAAKRLQSSLLCSQCLWLSSNGELRPTALLRG